MNYPDTDTTRTDWGNLRRQNETEFCPVTGVPRMQNYPSAENSNAIPLVNHVEIERQSKLGAMFNKFLYQK
jgi:hypothetical protein